MAGQLSDRLDRRLAEHLVVGLDTSIWIYHLEAHPRYLPLTTHILSKIEARELRGVISTVVVLELTVRPFRLERPEIARQYEALLVNFPNLEMVDINRDVARHAAQLRGVFGLGALDALQVASAQMAGATAFITNDVALGRLSEVIDIVLLNDFLDHRWTNGR